MAKKRAKAAAEAEHIDVRRADEYTLGTRLQMWYELYAKPHLRFSTAEYYRRGIELHITPRIGDIPLKKLTGRDLQGLYKDLQEHRRLREAQKGTQPGLSASTIRGIHTMLHNALDRAVKERLIVRNPADDCIPPEIQKHEMKILPPERIRSNAWPLRYGIYAAHLHPRHAPNAGERGGKAGKLHGAGPIKTQKAPERIRRISSPALLRYFRVWVTVWVRRF